MVTISEEERLSGKAESRQARLYEQRGTDCEAIYCIDTLIITLQEEYGWGYDRLMNLMVQWDRNRKKFQEAINPDNVEADVAQDHIDRIMERIIRGKQEMIPFQERYPTLKKIKY